jgi:hypothetical protein
MLYGVCFLSRISFVGGWLRPARKSIGCGLLGGLSRVPPYAMRRYPQPTPYFIGRSNTQQRDRFFCPLESFEAAPGRSAPGGSDQVVTTTALTKMAGQQGIGRSRPGMTAFAARHGMQCCCALVFGFEQRPAGRFYRFAQPLQSGRLPGLIQLRLLPF